MQRFICITCGTQYAPAEQPPDACPICLDERQYVGHGGQQWTTLERMRAAGSRNEVQNLETDLTQIHTAPQFAIGQRALLVQTPQGNVLWDCISYLDQVTEDAVRDLGGITAIAISHPHFYSSMAEWAERFDAPIYLHEANRRWVMQPSERIVYWEGEQYSLWDGITVARLGGHFPGGTVLHWAAGAEGRGALLTGDIITVVADRRWVTFMYSFPNLIPLPAAEVQRIGEAAARYQFDRIHGGWPGATVTRDAHGAIARSVDRYRQAVTTGLPG